MKAQQLEAVVEYALGFTEPGQRIDWEDLLARIESVFDIDLPEKMSDPEIRQIQNAVRKARREADA